MKSKKKIKVLPCIAVFILLCITLAFGINEYVKGSVRDRILTVDEASKLEGIDCILVLGCQVHEDGTLSLMLSDRLDVAEDVYKTGVTEKILMSGDHGKKDYDEVNAMKNYVTCHGVAKEENVFCDHAGFSTYESMYRAKEVFNVKRVIIVTQRYHMYRALYIAKKLGLEAYGVTMEDRYSGKRMRELREILARDKDFFKCILKLKPTYLGDVIDIHGSADASNG